MWYVGQYVGGAGAWGEVRNEESLFPHCLMHGNALRKNPIVIKINSYKRPNTPRASLIDSWAKKALAGNCSVLLLYANVV